MSVSLNDWSYCLSRAANQQEPALICECQEEGQEAVIATVSQEDYNEYIKNPTSEKIRKLSFHEIVSISNSFATVPRIVDFGGGPCVANYSARANAELNIENAIHLDDIFKVDVRDSLMEKINDQLNGVEEFKVISSSLQTIYQRSQSRRLEEKTKSIWGSVKYFFWSCFFDKGTQINTIKASIPTEQGILNTANTAIRERINFNIDFFGEEIGIKTNSQFTSPSEVRTKWLKKYAPDKFKQQVSVHADTYRTRVIAMLKIWEDILKLNKTENRSIPEPKISSTVLRITD